MPMDDGSVNAVAFNILDLIIFMSSRPLDIEAFFFFFFLLDMFIQHTAFLLDKGSQDRRRGILPPAVSIYWYGLLILV